MSNHNIRVDAIGLAAEVVELRNEIARLKNQTNWVCQCGGTDCKGQRENAELNATLDAVIAADERAVELWRAAHPGNELVIPDRGRLVGWLLEQNAALRTALKRWLKVADDCHQEQQEVGYSEYNITVGLVCDTRALLDAARKQAQP